MDYSALVYDVDVTSKHLEEVLFFLLVVHDKVQLLPQQLVFHMEEEFHCLLHYSHESYHSPIHPEIRSKLNKI